MQKKNLIVICATMFISTCGVAYSSDEPCVGSLDLLSKPSAYDNEVISTSGYLKTSTRVPRFYVSKEAAEKSDFKFVIDVYSDDKAVDNKMAIYKDATCMVLIGKFRAYDPKRLFVGFGDFVSSAGVMDVSVIIPCN